MTWIYGRQVEPELQGRTPWRGPLLVALAFVVVMSAVIAGIEVVVP